MSRRRRTRSRNRTCSAFLARRSTCRRPRDRLDEELARFAAELRYRHDVRLHRLNDSKRSVGREVHVAPVGLHAVGLVDALDLVVRPGCALCLLDRPVASAVTDRSDRSQADTIAPATAAEAPIPAQLLVASPILRPTAR